MLPPWLAATAARRLGAAFQKLNFVRDLTANPDAQAIVRSIISLGKGLGVTITAEGVETEAEVNCLRNEGCHEGQGFLFSRALPNADVMRLLQAQGQCSAALVA